MNEFVKDEKKKKNLQNEDLMSERMSRFYSCYKLFCQKIQSIFASPQRLLVDNPLTPKVLVCSLKGQNGF